MKEDAVESWSAVGCGKGVTLFNLEGTTLEERKNKELGDEWGYSSAGRAPALQAGGRRFDPDYLHQLKNGLVAQLARAYD